MKRLLNKFARGVILSSFVLAPFLGFSQDKIKPVNSYSSITLETMHQFPGYWQGFDRKELSNDTRLGLGANYFNFLSVNKNNNYKFDARGTVQQKFLLGNSDFYLGGGLFLSGSDKEKLSFKPGFVSGVDLNLDKNTIIYLQGTFPVGVKPFFSFGLVKKF